MNKRGRRKEDPCDDDEKNTLSCVDCTEYRHRDNHVQCRGICASGPVQRRCNRPVSSTSPNNGYCYQHKNQYLPTDTIPNVLRDMIDGFNIDLLYERDGMHSKWLIPPGGIQININIVHDNNDIDVRWGEQGAYEKVYTPNQTISRFITNPTSVDMIQSVYILGAFSSWEHTRSNLVEIVSWGKGQRIGTDCSGKFMGNDFLIGIGNPPGINEVTNMSKMFKGAYSFNQPLDTWNTENVRNMSGMFTYATSFNQPLNTWKTDNVQDMSYMFEGAIRFNQPLNTWNTEKVRKMSAMFAYAINFNQPLNNTWNTGNVENMSRMFAGAIRFNQPLNTWNTENVRNMSGMFENAASFKHHNTIQFI